MKDCRYLPASKFGRYAAQFFYPAIGFLLVLGSILVVFDSLANGLDVGSAMMTAVIVLVLAFLIFAVSFRLAAFERRRFKLTHEGIVLKGTKDTFYSWDQVHEVVIMPFGASASLQNYQTVICCFLTPRTDRVSQRIVRSYIYGARHLDDFVVIDDSPEIREMFSDVYPGTIADCTKSLLNT